MFVRLALVSVCAGSLLQPVSCYRIDTKRVLEMKMMKARGLGLNETALNEAALNQTALNETDLNETFTNDTISAIDDNILFLAHDDSVPKPGGDILLDFVKGTEASSARTIGNMLAQVGLVRARLVLRVTSWVLPESLAERILPASLIQQAPAAPAAEGPERSSAPLMRAVGFLVLAAVVYKVCQGGLELALSSKMLVGGDDGANADEIRATVRLTAQYAIPQILGSVLYMSNEIFSTLAIGHVGTKEQLAAVGLCNMMANGFLYPLTFGFLSPLDALVSTAWGAGDKELCLAYVNKARFLGSLQIIWLFPIFWYAEPILLVLGQDPAVAQHVSGFSKVMGVAYVPFLFNMSNNWLFKNIGDPLIGLIGLFFGNCVHVTMCIVLVVHHGWGNLGIVVSWVANQATWNILQSLYMVTKSDLRDEDRVALFLLSPRMCTTSLVPYMKLALPSILAMGSEMWFWEIATMLVGTMSSTALAAHVSANNAQAVLMMGPLGLSSAGSTIVGQTLGAGKVGLVRAMLKILPVFAFTLWSVLFYLLIAYRRQIAHVYCKEVDVQDITVTLLAIIAFSGFLNSMQSVTSGCLKGMAKHKTVANIVLTCFYLIILPLAYILGVVLRFGIYGVYAAFFIGQTLMFGWMAYRMVNVDLLKESENAQARMEAASGTSSTGTG